MTLPAWLPSAAVQQSVESGFGTLRVPAADPAPR